MNLKHIGKSLFVMGLFHMLAILQSCCKDGARVNYTLRTIQVTNFDLNTFERIAEGSTVDYTSYGIQIQFDLDVLVQAGIGLFPSAYASIDCEDDLLLSISDKVVQAQILATSDFDSNHPAGSPLNDLFEYQSISQACFEQEGDLELCSSFSSELLENSGLETITNENFSINEYFNTVEGRSTELNLAILKSKPSTSDSLQFILKLNLESGQVLSDTSEYVRFN